MQGKSGDQKKNRGLFQKTCLLNNGSQKKGKNKNGKKIIIKELRQETFPECEERS